MLALAHELLRALLVAPEIGGFGEIVQLGKTVLGLVPVKDASAAGSRTA